MLECILPRMLKRVLILRMNQNQTGTLSLYVSLVSYSVVLTYYRIQIASESEISVLATIASYVICVVLCVVLCFV